MNSAAFAEKMCFLELVSADWVSSAVEWLLVATEAEWVWVHHNVRYMSMFSKIICFRGNILRGKHPIQPKRTQIIDFKNLIMRENFAKIFSDKNNAYEIWQKRSVAPKMKTAHTSSQRSGSTLKC